MPSDLPRRAFLVSLGAGGLAGCAGRPGADGSPRDRTRPDATPVVGGTRTDTPMEGPDTPDALESEWPMPAHDSGRTSAAPAAGGPVPTVRNLWSVSVGTEPSAPVVAGGTLYVGLEDGALLALDARNGERRWQTSVGTRVGAPRVESGSIFVPTASSVVAIDTDGGERWRVPFPGAGESNGSDLLVASHGVYALADSRVVALNHDGSERWRADLNDPWQPYLFASDDRVYVSTGTNGRIPWTLSVRTGEVVGDEPEPGNDFPAERACSDGTVFAVDPFFGVVHATAVEDGGASWNRRLDAYGDQWGLGVGPDRVYVVFDGGEQPGLYTLSRSDGTVEWRSPEAFRPVERPGRPVVTGEAVLVRTDAALFCFDAEDGTIRWTRSRAVGRAIAVVDDVVYTAGDGEVGAKRPP